jgi:pimeloyl-ACP methyl ester carboxylesterase
MAPDLLRIRCLWLLPLLAGCAGVPPRVESHAPPDTVRGLVVVADGAGAWQTASKAMAAMADSQHLPIHVSSFDWTHGRGRPLADVVDYPYARCQGRRMAEEIVRIRAANPGVPISAVGYSAGSGVALAAAENLPADYLERIVLLAPAVSACYDLRRALASARRGIDVFISDRDTLYLGLGTGLVGTTDNKRGAAAGRCGFSPPADPALAARLHQHPWTPAVEWTGNEGGHAGSLQPAYLRLYVMPLLVP